MRGLLAVVFTLGAVGAHLALDHEREQIEDVRQRLASMTDFKAAAIGAWLAERTEEARRVAADATVVAEARSFVARSRRGAAIPADLHAWLSRLRHAHGYERLSLANRDGHLLASAGLRAARAEGATPGFDLADAIRAGRVYVTGYHAATPDGEFGARLNIVVPLPERAAAAALVATLDPSRFLLPSLASWPVPSRSGETLLAAEDDGAIVYLAPLRYMQAGHRPRIPVSEEALLGSMVARGARGLIEGIDYRGVEVVGAGTRVAGTSWIILSKEDTAEAYLEIRDRTRLVLGLLAVLTAALALGVVLWGRTQALRLAAARRETLTRVESLRQHFAYLSRFANDIVLLVDEAGRIVETNDRASAAYGYAREELLGKPMTELRAEGCAPSFRPNLEPGGGLVYEVDQRRADGSTFPAELSIRSMRVQERTFTQAIIRDVTYHRRSEAQLRLYAMVFEHAREAFLITDAERRIVSINRAFTETTGYEPAEVIGRNPKLLASGRHDPEFYRAMWQSIRERGFWQGEIWNRRKSGEIYAEWETIAAVRDGQAGVRHYIAVFSDITERKYAEFALRSHNRELEAAVAERTSALGDALELNCKILQAATIGIAAYRASGECVFANQAIAAALGVSPERAIAANLRDHPSWQRADLPSVALETLESGKLWRGELFMETAFGRAFWAEMTLARFMRGGEPHLLVLLEDITEHKHIEQVLRDAKAEAERASSAKSEFLTRMSHELRTPLNAILGFSQILALEPLAPHQHEHVREIDAAGRHLLDLVSDLLDMSRIEAGRLSTEVEPVSLGRIVREAVHIADPHLRAKVIALKDDSAAGNGEVVLADPTRLRQVVVNLLSNAAKYNRAGGRVIIDCAPREAGLVRLSVSDDGAGIAAHDVARLFTPFERLGAEKSGVDGVGIGLALSKRLAEAMGCTLGVESTPGLGSTFWIDMPRADRSDRGR